jgi:hypothetical protein
MAIRQMSRPEHRIEVIAAIGAILADYRVSLHMTQAEAADEAGIDRQTWMFAERGVRSAGRDVSCDGERPVDHELVEGGKRAIKIVEVSDATLVHMARAVGIPPHRLAGAGRSSAARLLEGALRADDERLARKGERVHPVLRRINETLWKLDDDHLSEAGPLLDALGQYVERLAEQQHALTRPRRGSARAA